MNIYFCGLIGSGKTTIGRRIAEELRLAFYDIDQEIDRRAGCSFHLLVQQQGWIPYREHEYAICRDLAAGAAETDAVVSMAGGTVRYEWNMDVLRGSGIIILLESSLDELARRVCMADRPRVNPGTTLEEDLRIMWEQHGHKYRNAADIVYRTDRKTVDEEVSDILNLVLTDPQFAGLSIRRS